MQIKKRSKLARGVKAKTKWRKTGAGCTHSTVGSLLMNFCLTPADFLADLRTNYLLTPCSTVLLQKLTGFAANQEIPRILWNPEVHHRTHKRPRHLRTNTEDYPALFALGDKTLTKKTVN